MHRKDAESAKSDEKEKNLSSPIKIVCWRPLPDRPDDTWTHPLEEVPDHLTRVEVMVEGGSVHVGWFDICAEMWVVTKEAIPQPAVRTPQSKTLQTFTGLQRDPFVPEPEQICIEDIAHGLALTCRWGRQCKFFYSVAQHSVMVCDKILSKYAGGDTYYLALLALLHDAAEAYLDDLPSPAKAMIPGFVGMERRILRNIGIALNVDGLGIEYGEIKDVDRRLAATEARDLMFDWKTCATVDAEPYPAKTYPLGWELAERMFLKRYEYLSAKQATEATENTEEKQ